VGELAGNWKNWSQFEFAAQEPPGDSKENRDSYENLLAYSGFPEPFLRNSRSFYNRWFEERKTLLVREDIRDSSAKLLSHMKRRSETV